MNGSPVEKRHLIPRPPQTMNLTDFIVTLFAVLVATVFLIITITAVLLALFSDKSVSAFFAIITDTMTTITAALVGYIAGRGVGSRSENQ